MLYILQAVILDLPRLLGITRDDLDFLRRKFVSIFAFELYILHDECPDIVTEAVGLKVTLGHEYSVLSH